MTTAWVIALREVREKARLFLVCAALALVPFAATLLPGTSGKASLTIAVTGGFLAAVFGLGIAATLGASTIARDLSERRMTFYFTKPISACAIWLGKASASLFVSLGCAAIIATPAVLASREQWVMHWLGDVQPLAVLAVAMVVTFFLAHVLSSVIRSRSPLLALDFLFLIVALAALYLIIRPLFLGAAVDLIVWMLNSIAVAVLIVIAIAPAWQLAGGRTDIRRSHAALMRFLWPAIAFVLLTAGGFVAWLTRVSPRDMAVGYVDQPPRGAAVIVTGTARKRFEYHATFLVDRATGELTRIASPRWWGVRFSGDGRVAAWLQPLGLFAVRGLELHTVKGPTGIVLPTDAGFMLSEDGTRVAILNGSLVAVHDLQSGKLLASAAGLDGSARQQMFFVTRDLVRVIEHDPRPDVPTPLRIFELDVRARKTRKTGERIVLAAPQAASVTGDGSRMFIRGANVIADGRTGATIAQLDAANVKYAHMLADGRVAVIARDGGAPHLLTFERDGTPRHDLALPDARAIWIAAETENGKLILTAYGKTMYVVDLASGLIERKIEGIRGPAPRWSSDPRLVRFAADQEFVAVDANGKLVVWSVARPEPRPMWSAEAVPPLSNSRE